jgi:succinyl-CoA synthetase alpha subunit
MLLDEFNAKKLFAAAGIPVPQGVTVRPAAITCPGFAPPWIVKSQVLSGGRGKAGGVLRAGNLQELQAAAEKIFALPIGGKLPPFLLVEPAADIAREFYMSYTVSRDRESLVFTVKAAGGVDVESGGEALTQAVRLPGGPTASQVRAAFFRLGLERPLYAQFEALALALFRAVKDNGLLLAEINPLALTGDGKLLALDAKAEIDDSAAETRPDLAALAEPGHYGEREITAREAGFSYVRLGGFVGCVANGAGLAMATMDALNFAGLPAANFLDLGGTADEKRMRAALTLLFEDEHVKLVFINLYGGILSCADVARALMKVLGGGEPKKPIVARIAGNSSDEGRAIMRESGLTGLHLASDMTDALHTMARLAPREKAAVLPEITLSAANLPPVPARPGAKNAPSPLDFNQSTRVLVQGLTGKVGGFHAGLMRAYGTNVVAGVTPFKGGAEALGVPVYDTVFEAVREQKIDMSVVFVPGSGAAQAVLEAASAGVPWIVCITEGIPQQDMLEIMPSLRETGACLIGPNTPGVIVPGRFKAGIMPVDPFAYGPVAVFSRSGTLTYEASARLSAAGMGQALAVGVGGDPFIGLGFAELLDMVRDDERVKAVLLLGEIGGRAEEDVAAYVAATKYPKPVASFVAGLTAPPGRRMGHAGAILEEGGGVSRKLSALKSAGIEVCQGLDGVADVMRKLL